MAWGKSIRITPTQIGEIMRAHHLPLSLDGYCKRLYRRLPTVENL